jgi:hypothetical protein
MNNYYLITEFVNYSDEFNIEAFIVKESELDLEDFKNNFYSQCIIEHNQEFPLEFYFGTNQCIYIESKDELLESVAIRQISKSEFELLIKLFPNCNSYSFGTSAII